MEIGIDSFVAAVPDSLTGANLSPQDRISHLLEEIQLADEVGLNVFGIGEHHRAEFLDSAPETLLAAAAATRSQYEAVCGTTGAMLVSDPERVAEKIIAFDETLGGISRLAFQMSIASLPHSNRMRAIELIGAKVAPLVRGEIRREVQIR